MSDVDFAQMIDRVEPLRLAHRVDAGRVWLYSGRLDDVVPSKSSDLFASAAGLQPEHHIKLLANHYSGIIFLPMISQQISRRMRE